MAVWQLQPYESLLSSSSCPLPSSSSKSVLPAKIASSSSPNFSTLPHLRILSRRILFQTISSSRAGPRSNLRTFRAYGSAAALFVQMGAYRGGPNIRRRWTRFRNPRTFTASPGSKCEWVPQLQPFFPPLGPKAYKMLPDWGYSPSTPS
ncbi:hypothetical protein HPP92_003464 [Vanilla planifolia]|uniref:Uncharacterized protein n=1 Tax=Vanilla planifolia TaxID=51239 RepID=A0A835VJC8_VANPL|nr:hypothetical protein HPP92_003841 [Vanilla planifolia]KAG0503392.1 hypothetical protein HPP92_003464 [Vanilla planifolia]